jgi:hypothetical protein
VRTSPTIVSASERICPDITGETAEKRPPHYSTKKGMVCSNALDKTAFFPTDDACPLSLAAPKVVSPMRGA